jgi:YcaO-like protein with predicted kinase domain
MAPVHHDRGPGCAYSRGVPPLEPADAALDPLIAAYTHTLGRFGELVEAQLSSLDRLGVPVTSCSLLAAGCVVAHGNGYGATTAAARLSGLGELAEGVLSTEALARLRPRQRTGSYRELLAAEGSQGVADPRTLCLPAGSPWTIDTPLTWLPLQRLRTGEEVLVPVELVASEPGELPPGTAPPLLTPITNGLGAGLDQARPLAHGLLEILQRHTNGLRFRALDARSPEIDRAGLPASVTALVARLEESGVELVLKHAGTELGVCSTYVLGVDAHPDSAIQVTACGEAADPSAEASLTKAVLEYANSRARKAFMFGRPARSRPLAPPAYWTAVDGASGGEARATAAMTAWRDLGVEQLSALTAPDRRATVPYAAVTTDAPELDSTEAVLGYLLDRLAGHDVLASTVTVDDVSVAKVVVPGLEVETLSYGRVGEVNAGRLLETDLDLVRRQDGPTTSHPDRIVLTPEAEERLGGPVWYSYAATDRVVGPLYPLYREPPRHSVTLSAA